MAIFNNAVYQAFIWIFDNVAHNYILTIILATVVFKTLTLPADLKQRKESRKMAAVAPEMQKLQKRYANDPKKFQRKQAELYKEKGVSMYASCLPMLLTIPIFTVFFGGLRLLANEMNVRIALEVASGNVAFLDNFSFLWIHNIFQPDSGMAGVMMSLKDFTALMSEKQLGSLFMLSPEVKQAALALLPNYESLVLAPANAHVLAGAPAFLTGMLSEGGTLANGWFILPLISAAAALLQSKLMAASQPQAQSPGANSKMMLYFTAAISLWFCTISNSVFAVYWITSNVFSLAVHFALQKLYPPVADTEALTAQK